MRFEEYKEADSVSGEAAHRISRGIHDKVLLICCNCDCLFYIYYIIMHGKVIIRCLGC